MFTTRARLSPDLSPFCKPFFCSSVMEGYGRRQRVRWMENDCVEQSCLGGLCSLSLFLPLSLSLFPSVSLSLSFHPRLSFGVFKASGGLKRRQEIFTSSRITNVPISACHR